MKCPLQIWTPDKLYLTKLEVDIDIRPSYSIMLKEADDKIFNGKLVLEANMMPDNEDESEDESPYSALGRSVHWP